MRNLLFFSILILFTSCAFVPHRSYVDQMEDDGVEYFQAGRDFPQVAGDNGKYFADQSDWEKRTPQSYSELRATEIGRAHV